MQSTHPIYRQFNLFPMSSEMKELASEQANRAVRSKQCEASGASKPVNGGANSQVVYTSIGKVILPHVRDDSTSTPPTSTPHKNRKKTRKKKPKKGDEEKHNIRFWRMFMLKAKNYYRTRKKTSATITGLSG